jgi:N-acetylglucosaminyltransferase
MVYWLLQLADLIQYNIIHLFFIYGAFCWFIWLVRLLVSAFYRPFKADVSSRVPVSILVPILNENIDVLNNCLKSLLQNTSQNDEVLALLDVRNSSMQILSFLFDHPRLRVIVAPEGKRPALVMGYEAAKNPIVIVTGSDTTFDKDTVNELVKPFVDPRVGGVTGKVLVGDTKGVGAKSYKWAMELRNRMIYPAMSVTGAVHVLNGELYAVRKQLAVTFKEEFLNQKFMGKICDSGDDGWMTTLLLKHGNRTVYQSTSVAITIAPSSFRAFLRQQLRWNRNSTRRSLMVLFQSWAYTHGPLYPLQLLTALIKLPFWVVVIVMAAIRLIIGHNIGVVSTSWFDPYWHQWRILIFLGGIMLIRLLRGLPYLISDRKAWLFWPLYSFLAPFVLGPYKLWAMLTARDTRWMTRGKEKKTNGNGKLPAAAAAIIGFCFILPFLALGVAFADDDFDSY